MAREIEQMLTSETLEFIVPTLWLANSPDFSTVDYQICSRIHDVAQLKSCLIKE